MYSDIGRPSIAPEKLLRALLLQVLYTIRSERTQLKNTYAIEASRLEKMRDNIQVLLAVKKSRVAQLARALDRARAQADDLKVVAGISGIVQAIDVDVGQQLQPARSAASRSRINFRQSA
jgi:multidrug resistance efflux pump